MRAGCGCTAPGFLSLTLLPVPSSCPHSRRNPRQHQDAKRWLLSGAMRDLMSHASAERWPGSPQGPPGRWQVPCGGSPGESSGPEVHNEGLEAEQQLGPRRALSHCWGLREGGDTQTEGVSLSPAAGLCVRHATSTHLTGRLKQVSRPRFRRPGSSGSRCRREIRFFPACGQLSSNTVT